MRTLHESILDKSYDADDNNWAIQALKNITGKTVRIQGVNNSVLIVEKNDQYQVIDFADFMECVESIGTIKTIIFEGFSPNMKVKKDMELNGYKIITSSTSMIISSYDFRRLKFKNCELIVEQDLPYIDLPSTIEINFVCKPVFENCTIKAGVLELTAVSAKFKNCKFDAPAGASEMRWRVKPTTTGQEHWLRMKGIYRAIKDWDPCEVDGRLNPLGVFGLKNAPVHRINFYVEHKRTGMKGSMLFVYGPLSKQKDSSTLLNGSRWYGCLTSNGTIDGLHYKEVMEYPNTWKIIFIDSDDV